MGERPLQVLAGVRLLSARAGRRADVGLRAGRDHDIRNGPESLRVLGVLHLLASTTVTLSAAFVATVPAYLQLRAEWETTPSERVQDLTEASPDAGDPAAAARVVVPADAASAPVSN